MGHLQEAIIEIGKEKGFVTIDDVSRFYPHHSIRREMSKLVSLGYFKEISEGYKVYWKYIKNEKN
jgi:hypothetical protein